MDPELNHTETYPTRAEAQTALDRIRADAARAEGGAS